VLIEWTMGAVRVEDSSNALSDKLAEMNERNTDR
jgi:hypothetical protein